MAIRRLLAVSICAAVATGTGCRSIYRERPVTVLVRDAETKVPIAGAEVEILDPSSHPPRIDSGKSGSDGAAIVRTNPAADLTVMLEVAAAGYLSEEKDVPIEAVRAIRPAGPLGRSAARDPDFVVELFAGPRPAVELIVPSGYRGVLKAQLRVGKNGAYPPGQRSFSVAIPQPTVVAVGGTGPAQTKSYAGLPVLDANVVGPPVLLHGLMPNFSGKFADGTPLARDPKDSEVGLRWVRSEGDDQIFVVGTRGEWEEVRLAGENEAPRRSGGGQGGGHKGGGGGGRRGGGGSGAGGGFGGGGGGGAGGFGR